jgi:hypothetical protein
MSRRTGGIGQGFELALAILFGLLGLSDLEEFGHGLVDIALLAEDANLHDAIIDSVAEVGDLLELDVL